MIINIDIPISKSVKNEMIKTKELTSKSFSYQLKKIFSEAQRTKVENLAKDIICFYKLRKIKSTTKITVRIDTVFDEKYFRKIYYAILTRIPRLEFREMLSIIIHIANNKK